MNVLRFLAGADPTSVLSATQLNVPKPVRDSPQLVDEGMAATLAFPDDVTGSLSVNLREPFLYGIIPRFPKVHVSVQCENGEIRVFNFVMPTLYHYIEVKTKDKGGKTRTEKVYKPTEAGFKGEEWWLTWVYYPD